MHEWGLGALADDTQLLVSELVTNAYDASVILPDRPLIGLRLRAGHRSVIIEVWDQSPDEVNPSSHPDAGSEIGRGLVIVEALARRWGTERTGYRRKVVWAELALPA